MMFKSLTSAAISLALLAGCGGGASQSQPASASLASASTTASIVIDAEGDSTMFGLQTVNGTYVQSARPVPALVQAQLRQWFGPDVAVNANGVSGAKLDDELKGINKYTTPLSLRLAASRARIVVENFGINDTLLSAETYRANLIQFVDTVRASGKLPVLEEPNPVCAGNGTLDQLVAILDQVAVEKAVPLVKQYDAVKALPNWQAMLTDCVHPNDALYAFKAGREAEALAQVIRSASW